MIECRRYYFRHTKVTRTVVIFRFPTRMIRRARARAREARTKKAKTA